MLIFGAEILLMALSSKYYLAEMLMLMAMMLELRILRCFPAIPLVFLIGRVVVVIVIVVVATLGAGNSRCTKGIHHPLAFLF